MNTIWASLHLRGIGRITNIIQNEFDATHQVFNASKVTEISEGKKNNPTLLKLRRKQLQSWTTRKNMGTISTLYTEIN